MSTGKLHQWKSVKVTKIAITRKYYGCRQMVVRFIFCKRKQRHPVKQSSPPHKKQRKLKKKHLPIFIQNFNKSSAVFVVAYYSAHCNHILFWCSSTEFNARCIKHAHSAYLMNVLLIIGLIDLSAFRQRQLCSASHIGILNI